MNIAENRTEDSRRVIVALDFPDEKNCLQALENLDPKLCRVKVGKELFTRCGPQLVKRIVEDDYDVFLDLKFHDIPNTVASAVSAAADLGVWMVNVHASGGRAMMLAAKDALALKGVDSPLLIAVTVLTSMGSEDMDELGLVSNEPKLQVARLASLSKDCGLDGVVCSAQEVEFLRKDLGNEFLLVTPGIRPAGDDVGDQKRVETPASAIRKGSDYLVIGRPITQSDKPIEKLKNIIKEIENSKN